MDMNDECYDNIADDLPDLSSLKVTQNNITPRGTIASPAISLDDIKNELNDSFDNFGDNIDQIPDLEPPHTANSSIDEEK